MFSPRARSTRQEPAQYARTCQALQSVFDQLESLLPSGLAGLDEVRQLQLEFEGIPARRRRPADPPRSLSA